MDSLEFHIVPMAMHINAYVDDCFIRILREDSCIFRAVLTNGLDIIVSCSKAGNDLRSVHIFDKEFVFEWSEYLDVNCKILRVAPWVSEFEVSMETAGSVSVLGRLRVQ